MNLEPGHSYHIFNQGNNQRPIFFEKENYLFFLRKMRIHLLPYSNIMAYCLMPNHFHWFLHIHSQIQKDDPDLAKTTAELLTKNIGTLLSSYAQAINNKYNRSGSLFRHKTKSSKIDTLNYGITCLHYIHQNPIRANLVQNIEDWPFSSYPDYAGTRNGTLVSKKFTRKYLDIKEESIIRESRQVIDPKIAEKIY